jgi:hypothetical protein
MEMGNVEEERVPPWSLVILKKKGCHSGVRQFGKSRGATVEFGNLEKGVPPWFLVIWKKKRCRREVW